MVELKKHKWCPFEVKLPVGMRINWDMGWWVWNGACNMFTAGRGLGEVNAWGHPLLGTERNNGTWVWVCHSMEWYMHRIAGQSAF